MNLLAFGILIFFLVHIIPTTPVLRNRMVATMGAGPYKLVFSLASAVGLGLMIYGFSIAPPLGGYDLPAWGQWLPLLAMPFAFILLVAAYVPSNIKRWTRHPMTLGVLLWAGAHLLASPSAPSGMLFGSFALYAVLNLVSQLIRPQPTPPAPQPRSRDLMVVGIGLALFVVITLTHHILFGRSALPMIFGSHGAGLAGS